MAMSPSKNGSVLYYCCLHKAFVYAVAVLQLPFTLSFNAKVTVLPSTFNIVMAIVKN